MNRTTRQIPEADACLRSPAVREFHDGIELTVQTVELGDGRFRYLARSRLQAADGRVRDDYVSQETYDSAEAAIADGVVKARQFAGIDVPEA